jgi:hypothetical protein
MARTVDDEGIRQVCYGNAGSAKGRDGVNTLHYRLALEHMSPE